MDKKLFVVTNRKLIKKGDLSDVVKACVKGGADAIILREKDLHFEELYALALSLNNTIENKIPLIVNNNFQVAKAALTRGIHLSFSPFMNFKEKYNGLKGVSIHSLEEGICAESKGANYVLAGHVFNTSCKMGIEGRGLVYLQQLCERLTLPVIAIGGIDLNNIKEVLNAGASGIAVMSSVMEADNVEGLVHDIKEAMRCNSRSFS